MQTLLSLLARGAIYVYRRWLSRLKGYRCAHQHVHAQGTCSAYGKEMFERHSFSHALALTRQRLRDCKSAYALYESRLTPRERTHHWEKRNLLISPAERWGIWPYNKAR